MVPRCPWISFGLFFTGGPLVQFGIDVGKCELWWPRSLGKVWTSFPEGLQCSNLPFSTLLGIPVSLSSDGTDEFVLRGVGHRKYFRGARDLNDPKLQ